MIIDDAKSARAWLRCWGGDPGHYLKFALEGNATALSILRGRPGSEARIARLEAARAVLQGAASIDLEDE